MNGMPRTINLTEEQRDCLQEVTNVAMGQAGDNLARLLDTFVILSIPISRGDDALRYRHGAAIHQQLRFSIGRVPRFYRRRYCGRGYFII